LTTPVKEGRKKKPFVTKWKKKKNHLQEAYPERVEKSRTQATWKILRRWHLEESWATALSSYLHQHHACCVSPPQFEWKFSFFDSGIAHKSGPFSLFHTPSLPPSPLSLQTVTCRESESERAMKHKPILSKQAPCNPNSILIPETLTLICPKWLIRTLILGCQRLLIFINF
jgi:hypothetical protein